MYLKVATMEDFETVFDMSLSFLKESPYRDIPSSHSKIVSFIRLFLEDKGSERVCILAFSKENIPIGIIAGQLSSVPFSDHKVASEVMWWVSPNHRGVSRAAVELLGAFEHWGRIRGSSFIQMQSLASLNGFKVGKLLNRLGYEEKEVAYLKDIS